MGNVVSAGLGQNPARQAALNGGLPDHVAALTINKVCGSGLKAVMLADQGDPRRRHRRRRRRRHGVDEQLPVPAAARARRAAHGQRRGRRLDDQRRPVVRVRAVPHGQLGRGRRRALPRRPRARRTSTPRAAIRRRRARPSEGAFADEILPIAIPQKKGAPLVVDRDESIRADTTAEALAALKPAFKKDGTVTAGNAPGVNDGASALVVMAAERAQALGLAPLARIVGAGDQRAGAEVRADDAGRSGAPRRREGRLGPRRRRSLRAERSVLGAGRRGAQRARHRSPTR